MTLKCSLCGSSTIWDDSVSSSVCTDCGNLENPSQSVLTSSSFVNQNNTSEPSLWDSTASITLKSLRAGSNWDLVGQGKEARDRKNMFAMAEFIKSLAVSLNATGLSPRAIILFNQVRAASGFRWGQKSRNVAGACLAIAFRESNRPDSLRDIAHLLNVAPKTVTREFMSITTTLKLSLTLVDPSVHISALHTYLASSVRNPQDANLPISVTNALHSLCLRSVAKTAESLSQVLNRLSPDHEIIRLPVAPTACGIFLLALEGERRSVINPLGDMADVLASRCHSTKCVVMARYKTLQDEIAIWIQKVPWLDKYESKRGRAAVAKRVVVARGLKDVIQFQEDIWRQQHAPSLRLELDDSQRVPDEHLLQEDISCRPSKRSKMDHPMTQATNFLLHPRDTILSSKLSSSHSVDRHTSNFPLPTYILTNSSSTFSYRHPTRLQLLVQERGGSSEEHIPDDDLFAEGEYDKMLRSAEEIDMMKRTFEWSLTEDSSTTSVPRKARKKRGPLDAQTEENITSPKKSRINLNALANLLAGDNEVGRDSDEEATCSNMLLGLEQFCDLNDEDMGDDYPDSDNEHCTDNLGPPLVIDDNISESPRHARKRRASEFDHNEDEVVIDNWHPPSPTHIGEYDSHYEQEYD